MNKIDNHNNFKNYTSDEVHAKLSTVYRCLTEDVTVVTPEDSESIAKINLFFLAELSKFDPLMLKAVDNSVNVFTYDSRPKETKFTDSEIKDISEEYVKVKKQEIKRKTFWNEMEGNLKNAKGEFAVFGLMARLAYCPEVTLGKIIQAGDMGAYSVSKIIENKQGLRAVYFEPIDPSESPILSFRGTSPTSRKNIIDDLQETIGDRSFRLSQDEITNLLLDAKTTYEKGTIITGHSLGGALAQRVTAENAQYGVIAKTFHYNAPGVGSNIVKTYQDNLEKLGNVMKPQIIDIHHYKDIVYCFGGDHLPTNRRFVLDTNSEISTLDSHKLNELNRLLMTQDENIVKRESFRFKILDTILESGRKLVSPYLIQAVRVGSAATRAFGHLKKLFGDNRGFQGEQIQKQMLNLENRPILHFF